MILKPIYERALYIYCNIFILLSCIKKIYSNPYPPGQEEYIWTWKYGFLPWAEVDHDPGKMTTEMPWMLNDSLEIPHPREASPDFRLPEPPWTAWKDQFYAEDNRPYRISPFWKQVYKINRGIGWVGLRTGVWNFGCYCTTAFKRITNLAGCGVITTRHALTTATSTELILRRYRHMKTLENILGIWYDHNHDAMNSSMYISVARIHYHPEYATPDRTNASHPIPAVHDLAVWATTYRFLTLGIIAPETKAIMCLRAVNTKYYTGPSTPYWMDLVHLIGFQFIWVLNRRPTPWVKYFVRVKLESYSAVICPKTEWGWFHCIMGDLFAKLGFDHGGALHFSDEKRTWRADGWVGINAFTMQLRSRQITNYFTVIDTQKNVDFLYSAYMGRLPYAYLDGRFFNSQWKAPRPKPYNYVQWVYDLGYQHWKWIPEFWK